MNIPDKNGTSCCHAVIIHAIPADVFLISLWIHPGLPAGVIGVRRSLDAHGCPMAPLR
jgi:hypothetical protein